MTTLLLDAPETASDAPAFAQLDPRIVTVWRVGATSWWAFWTLAATILALGFDRSPAWAVPVALLGAAWVAVVPARRYAHFRYCVGPVDVRVLHGWLWRHASVVLHARIQHVDTRQGPVARMLGLATVVMYTAGSVGAMVAIPGLEEARAEALRDRLAALSGTDDAV